MATTRNEVRMDNEGRTDQTDRNRKNRAKKKLRDTYGKPYPAGKKAAKK